MNFCWPISMLVSQDALVSGWWVWRWRGRSYVLAGIISAKSVRKLDRVTTGWGVYIVKLFCVNRILTKTKSNQTMYQFHNISTQTHFCATNTKLINQLSSFHVTCVYFCLHFKKWSTPTIHNKYSFFPCSSSTTLQIAVESFLLNYSANVCTFNSVKSKTKF